MTVRVLSRAEADALLKPIQLQIGQWNELAPLYRGKIEQQALSMRQQADETYSLCEKLSGWIALGAWTMFQVDNSTAPIGKQANTLEALLFGGTATWDIAHEKSFFLEGSRRDALLPLLIFISLCFEWHVGITSEGASPGQRLLLQDGLVYLIGDGATLNLESMLRPVA